MFIFRRNRCSTSPEYAACSFLSFLIFYRLCCVGKNDENQHQSQLKKPGNIKQARLEKMFVIKRYEKMTLENKLNITDAVELARVEEKLSKAKAHRLFTSSFLDGRREALRRWQAFIITFFLRFTILQASFEKTMSRKVIFALRPSCIWKCL